jgi:transcriptional regulator with XRE-family HTH domain
MDSKGRPPGQPRVPDKPLPEVFAANLRRVRERVGLSVAALAERCGFTVDFVDSVEKGVAPGFGLDQVARFASALGVDPAELVSRDAP